jgi:hypothetical protein
VSAGKKAKQPKKGKDAKASKQAQADSVRLANHPRATREIRKWRALGGLAGLGLAAYAANKGGLPLFDVGLRALVGGIVGSLVGWTVAVIAWRQMVVAELRAAHARLHPPPTPVSPDAQRTNA